MYCTCPARTLVWNKECEHFNLNHHKLLELKHSLHFLFKRVKTFKGLKPFVIGQRSFKEKEGMGQNKCIIAVTNTRHTQQGKF